MQTTERWGLKTIEPEERHYGVPHVQEQSRVALPLARNLGQAAYTSPQHCPKLTIEQNVALLLPIWGHCVLAEYIHGSALARGAF
jgi:hypothetical protein